MQSRFWLVVMHTLTCFSAMVVRFITRRYIGEYDPSLEKIYTYQTVIDNEMVYLEILDTAGQPHVSVGVLRYLVVVLIRHRMQFRNGWRLVECISFVFCSMKNLTIDVLLLSSLKFFYWKFLKNQNCFSRNFVFISVFWNVNHH